MDQNSSTILEIEKDLTGFDGDDRFRHRTVTGLCELDRITRFTMRVLTGLSDLMGGSALLWYEQR